MLLKSLGICILTLLRWSRCAYKYLWCPVLTGWYLMCTDLAVWVLWRKKHRWYSTRRDSEACRCYVYVETGTGNNSHKLWRHWRVDGCVLCWRLWQHVCQPAGAYIAHAWLCCVSGFTKSAEFCTSWRNFMLDMYKTFHVSWKLSPYDLTRWNCFSGLEWSWW